MALNLPCSCECHAYCHICGRQFIGSDPHVNCGDTVSMNAGGPSVYTIPVSHEPPTPPEPDIEAWQDFERNGYSDHEPVI